MRHNLVPLRHHAIATLSVWMNWPSMANWSMSYRFVEWQIKGKLEKAFKECKNEEDTFKLSLVNLVKAVLVRAKTSVTVNLDYFHLLEYMNRFNSFS
ncbi:hypothetical protein DVH24_019851 [Malus domestica]|uniref:Uncharacterized protein n=1 Tax=Malus domestica TaxID=3750 RepID=A0A498I788_MALDO|nr:hypothetical protein DVH24_019851 [Malus domestica]